MAKSSETGDQKPKQYKQLDYDEIMSLFDYHPWNIYSGGIKTKNPNVDDITHRILNIKKDDNKRARRNSVSFFKPLVESSFSNVLPDGDILFAIVPSHTAGSTSAGLMELVASIKDAFSFENGRNPLKRIKTINKLSEGGDRSMNVHRETLKVRNSVVVKDKVILLFDDVASTGNSLHACREVLLKSGARNVAMICLGQTVWENDLNEF